MFYERDERKRNLPGLINEKKFAEAYSTGAKILADEPNYLRAQIDLGYAGYLAASAKNESFNTTALDYARKAIQAIESGKAPTEWAPFKGKDDTLAYLNYAVGFLTLKTTPDQAIDSLIEGRAVRERHQEDSFDLLLPGRAYESGPYKTLSTAYQTEFANKPETPESKAALEKLNVVMDRIIDAYARAIAAAGTDPKTEQSRKEWLARCRPITSFVMAEADTGIDRVHRRSVAEAFAAEAINMLRIKWTDRRFNFDFPAGIYPEMIERVRGTPARLEDLLAGLPPETLTAQVDGRWSMQENAGHLLDLESLVSQTNRRVSRRQYNAARRRHVESQDLRRESQRRPCRLNPDSFSHRETRARQPPRESRR